MCKIALVVAFVAGLIAPAFAQKAEIIVGAMTGHRLRLIPSRLESFDRFRQRFPEGRVLVPGDPNAR